MGTGSGPAQGQSNATSGAGLGQIGGRPIEVWIVIALFGLPGAYLVIATLQAAPDAFRLLTESGPFFRLALLILWFWLVLLTVGLALFGIAWLIYKGDRVGRGLALFVAVEWALAVMIAAGSAEQSQVVVMLGALAATVILFVTPAATGFFIERDSILGAGPTSIVVVRVMVGVVAFFFGIFGLLYLVADGFASGISAVGVLFLAACPGIWILGRQLSTANQNARVALSVIAGILMVLGLVYGDRTVAALQPLAIVAVIPLGLWFAPDARRFFGDKPLDFQGVGIATSPGAGAVATSVMSPIVGGNRVVVKPQEAVDTIIRCDCGHALADGDAFCRRCGAPRPLPPTCDGCGATLDSTDVFCGICGAKVVQEATSADAVPSGAESAEPDATDPTPAEPVCSNCGTSAESVNDLFCSACGHRLVQADVCGNCGTSLGADERFCPDCGHRRP